MAIGGNGKEWFKASEIERAGFEFPQNGQTFREFAQFRGWTLSEHEGGLWCWAHWGRERRKLWHLERCRKRLVWEEAHQGAGRPITVRDPSWLTVQELAWLEAPALTKSPPSIRARLKALGLTAARVEGRAWRYRPTGDAKRQAKEFLIVGIIKALQKAWRAASAGAELEEERRRDTIARLIEALDHRSRFNS